MCSGQSLLDSGVPVSSPQSGQGSLCKTWWWQAQAMQVRSPTGRGWAWVFKAAGETVVVVEACAPHFRVSAAQLVPQWLSLAEANTMGGGKG